MIVPPMLMLFVPLTVGLPRVGPDVLSGTEYVPSYNNTVPGCWLGEQFYMVGDRWSPRIEPQGIMYCVKCQCAQVVRGGRIQMAGRVLCQNVASQCPRSACERPYLPPRACCKVCPGEDTVVTPYETDDTDEEAPTGSDETTDAYPSKPNLIVTAVLAGRGLAGRGEKGVRTRAAAVLHVLRASSDAGLDYAIRFQKLHKPRSLLFKDQAGNTVLEQRLPKQTKRTGVIYGSINYVTNDIIDLVTEGGLAVILTTSKHKKGGLFGALSENELANIGTFEAVLAGEGRRGIAGHVTLFYDTHTHVASYVVSMAGLSWHKLDYTDFVVSFEKSTEIKYQHVLNISPTTRRLVGQVNVDGAMSKQIARGKIHVRVTSRDGQTMTGQLRPRLIRTSGVSLLSSKSGKGAVSGHVTVRLAEDGALEYKVSVSGSEGTRVVLQRQHNRKGTWDDFRSLITLNSTQLQKDRTVSGRVRKMRARDTVAVLGSQIRLAVVGGSQRDFFYFISYPHSASFIWQAAPDVLLPKARENCTGEARMFTSVSPDCSFRYFVALADTSYEVGDPVTITMVSRTLGVVGRDKDAPWGELSELPEAVFKELSEGRARVMVNVSIDVCSTYEGQLRLPNHCWGSGSNTFWTDDAKSNDIDETSVFRCYYGGKFYAHAQSWIPDDGSACVTCRCNRGNVHCDEVPCPATTCRYPVQRPGECCPVCEEDNETEKRHKGSCYYPGDRRWHRVGTQWHPYVPPFGYSTCAVCNCVDGSLEVNCTRLPCPELSCPQHRRVRRHEEDCCQVCIDENFEKAFLNRHIKAQSSSACMFGGQRYGHGDKWHPTLHPFGEMKCYICSCKNGKSRCRKMRCPDVECSKQHVPTDACCPVCSDQKLLTREDGT
ncbi:chordin-like [Mya arenaria]|uniref:chordin-like n=1 Tax=Mya arenaria TaxID=6604 RepID=UPI0022E75EFE|nr:chordin-like [Mya arenaria]